jgi:hypothetical protein
VLAVLTLAASAVTAAAQSPALGEPKLTVLAGIGPATAGLGLQAELYFAHGRVSAFGGFGYLPEYGDDDNVVASGAGVTGNDFAESETSFIAFIGLGKTWRRK